jgi:hypothetical protein
MPTECRIVQPANGTSVALGAGGQQGDDRRAAAPDGCCGWRHSGVGSHDIVPRRELEAVRLLRGPVDDGRGDDPTVRCSHLHGDRSCEDGGAPDAWPDGPLYDARRGASSLAAGAESADQQNGQDRDRTTTEAVHSAIVRRQDAPERHFGALAVEPVPFGEVVRGVVADRRSVCGAPSFVLDPSPGEEGRQARRADLHL